MRWLVTGASGMLGSDFVTMLHDAGHEVTPVGRRDLDLYDKHFVADRVQGHDVVVNCAAWTAVDDAEEHEGEAHVANAELPRILAEACRQARALIVQISTDYVFAGDASSPYAETVPVAPRSAYGRTKAAGEDAVRAALADRHYIVRTAWLYGAHGSCFPRTIARVAAERGSVSVVDDQVGQPTWTVDVARLVMDLVASGAPVGTYHATSSGACSWFDFAREVVAASPAADTAQVKPSTSADVARPAPRPAYSVLGHEALHRAGIAPIGDWHERWAEAAPTVLA